jgi:hypothetical protein
MSGLAAACSGPALTGEPRITELASAGSAAGAASAGASGAGASGAGAPSYVSAGSAGAGLPISVGGAGSLHGPGYSGGSPLTASTKLPDMAKLSDDFHTYAVEWAPDSVKFYLDTAMYESRTPTDTPPGTGWAFNHPFYMILNVAVGGQWPGSPDESTPIPAQMLVDYVRVYAAN